MREEAGRSEAEAAPEGGEQVPGLVVAVEVPRADAAEALLARKLGLERERVGIVVGDDLVRGCRTEEGLHGDEAQV